MVRTMRCGERMSVAILRPHTLSPCCWRRRVIAPVPRTPCGERMSVAIASRRSTSARCCWRREIAPAPRTHSAGPISRGDARAACNLGVLLEQRGDPVGAKDAYRRADARGHGVGACNLGALLEQEGFLADAGDAYRRADERGDSLGAYRLGVLLEWEGDRARAIERLPSGRAARLRRDRTSSARRTTRTHGNGGQRPEAPVVHRRCKRRASQIPGLARRNGRTTAPKFCRHESADGTASKAPSRRRLSGAAAEPSRDGSENA